MTSTRDQFFIGGTWVDPLGGDVFTTTNSTTGAAIGTSPRATTGDLDRAVTAAQSASGDWRALGGAQRAAYLERLADALLERQDVVASLVSQEVGTPTVMAGLANAFGGANMLRYFAGLARAWVEEEPRLLPGSGVSTIVRRKPVAVAALIVPWNYPLSQIALKLGPALAVGATVVVKPSPETALSSYFFAEAVEQAGLPPGVVNIVPADRAESAYLVTHPGVDKVSFTGSTASGRKVAAACGELLRPVTLELGGKSAAVLLDDAPLDQFVQSLNFLSFANNGQTCANNTRVLVPVSRHDEILDAIASTVSGFTVGDPLDSATEIGPMVTAAHREKVLGHIRAGQDQGARRVVGKDPDTTADRAGGYFVAPTVFDKVQNDHRIAQEEIFGPVISVLDYGTGDDAAVALANATDYGLAGTVWSADHDRALSVAQRIDAGVQGINAAVMMELGSPFGGLKSSGLGTEASPESLEEYVRWSTYAFLTQ